MGHSVNITTIAWHAVHVHQRKAKHFIAKLFAQSLDSLVTLSSCVDKDQLVHFS